MECLPPARWAELIKGQMPPDETSASREHARACTTCAQRLAQATALGSDDPTGELPTAGLAPKARPVEVPLERGTGVGRYVVLECIGQGGMGMVYAAFDPELDRRVALKLLKSGEVSEQSRARLMREAQAMARLGHPNVVSVFDVGVHDGRIFIAMELVAGVTLKEWVITGKRSWREVVRVFAEAGRGLAAAHAAHLVHRDFKPANVLIGGDGRVRVTDFGLAREEGSSAVEPSAPDAAGDDTSSTHSLSERLTQVGSIVGTIGYMAPEQIRSQPLDPRTDQFSFCVCLWEALYGQRPFTAETPAGITQAALSGRLPDVPRGRGVPARLHALLVKGLAVEPAKRYPGMDALLVELTRDPRARLERAAPWLIAGALLTFAAGGVTLRQSRAAVRCGAAPSTLDGVWDPQVRGRVRAAFEATNKPFAAPALSTSLRALDAHAKAYVAARTAACEATHLSGLQADDVLALRDACFDRKLSELKAVSSVLAEADAPTVERSVTVVYGLSPLSDCDDVAALRAASSRDLLVDAEARALRETVLRGKALVDAGQYPKALALLEPAVQQAEALKRPGLHAQALLLLGYVLQQTGKFSDALAQLESAFRVALAAGLDEIATRAALAAVMVTGVLDKQGESRMWLDVSGALVARLGGDARLEVEQLRAQGIALATAGRFAEAAKMHEQTLARSLEVYGPDSPLNWKAYFDLGTACVGGRDFARAVPALERALQIKEQSQGADHPDVALVLANLGTSYFYSGDAERSRAAFERALDIRERLLGKESPRLVPLLNNFGDTLGKAGDYAPARAHLERAIALGDKALGESHAYTVACRLTLAGVLVGDERYADAEALLDKVAAAKPGPAYVAEASAVRALVLLKAGKAKEAKALAQTGVAAAEGLGPQATELIFPLVALGEALLVLKEERQALPPLERALDLATTKKAWAVLKADVEFPLARALLASGGDAQRALSLAADAQAAWATTRARKRELVTLEAWRQAAR